MLRRSGVVVASRAGIVGAAGQAVLAGDVELVGVASALILCTARRATRDNKT
jgi:hypothetical protein